jgi:hypothetical protein
MRKKLRELLVREILLKWIPGIQIRTSGRPMVDPLIRESIIDGKRSKHLHIFWEPLIWDQCCETLKGKVRTLTTRKPLKTFGTINEQTGETEGIRVKIYGQKKKTLWATVDKETALKMLVLDTIPTLQNQ